MNNWINHVKSFANENEMTYGEALRHPDCKQTYHTGSSLASGYISKLLKTGKFDISKMKKEPSKYLKKHYHDANNNDDESDNEDNYDNIAMELQQLIFKTPLNDIIKALVICKYKGKLHKNKMLMVMQIMQNINNIQSMKQLINALKLP